MSYSPILKPIRRSLTLNGVKAFKEAKADLVIAICGGSSIDTAKEKYGDIARAMGVDTTGISIDEAAHAAVEAARKLSLDLGIPQTLRELKIPENALPQLANDAINDVCTGGNPRAIDILELYKKAY